MNELNDVLFLLFLFFQCHPPLLLHCTVIVVAEEEKRKFILIIISREAAQSLFIYNLTVNGASVLDLNSGQVTSGHHHRQQLEPPHMSTTFWFYMVG